jgi:UDP-N-acetylmuramyl pentapeptide phosphotransferase/UDP-N-acetylglucosamine-1-phosphate transferase
MSLSGGSMVLATICSIYYFRTARLIYMREKSAHGAMKSSRLIGGLAIVCAILIAVMTYLHLHHGSVPLTLFSLSTTVMCFIAIFCLLPSFRRVP